MIVSSVVTLPCVTPRIATLFEKLNIFTIQDLLFHLPYRYEDRTRIASLNHVLPGDRVFIEGRIIKHHFTGKLLRATLLSDNRTLELIFFHYLSGHQKKLSEATANIRCFGEIKQNHLGQWEMFHPEYQIVSQITPNSALCISDRLTPVYSTVKGLTQTTFRKSVTQAFKLLDNLDIPELLPNTQNFQLKEALAYVHFPPAGVDQLQLRAGNHDAVKRLAFEELVAHQLSFQLIRQETLQQSAKNYSVSALKNKLLEQLPFALTQAQTRVLAEIENDLSKTTPMLRLVQGDVGSGKTIVACIAALHALSAGAQVALMAPTEILSEQHYLSFTAWLSSFGFSVAKLSGQQTAAEQKEIKNKLANGEVQLVIGTHALFQASVEFQQLGLMIIDEQHRFGVHQRFALLSKGFQKTHCPHQLIMTATPIPRTLAMLSYAHLDYSVIDELPPGRKPIKTILIGNDRRDDVIARVKVNGEAGKQTYWVCALIEESESLQCQAAEKTADYLKAQLPHLQVGLLHGQLSSEDKHTTMQLFKTGKIDLLVATTVIEVGVDVPNATVMVIENAERFGLAQLHQLRGRIGRGSQISFCVLLYQSPLTNQGKHRLMAMREHHDGFKIAEIDLQLRGAGEVFGLKQSGDRSFRIADIQRDVVLLEKAQYTSQLMIQQYPTHVPELIKRWIGEKVKYVSA